MSVHIPIPQSEAREVLEIFAEERGNGYVHARTDGETTTARGMRPEWNGAGNHAAIKWLLAAMPRLAAMLIVLFTLGACGTDVALPSCDALECHNVVCPTGASPCYCDGDKADQCTLPPPRVPTCAELGCVNTFGSSGMSTCDGVACEIAVPKCSDLECTPDTCVAPNGVHFTCEEG